LNLWGHIGFGNRLANPQSAGGNSKGDLLEKTSVLAAEAVCSFFGGLSSETILVSGQKVAVEVRLAGLLTFCLAAEIGSLVK